MKVAVLTSSRADYGIYYPLLNKLSNDSFFSLSILAFGTHLSKLHGYTVKDIEKDGFKVTNRFETFPMDDQPQAIVQSMTKTMVALASVWEETNFDIVFCLGDRYEMFAACASSVPYNIKLAHIHGGEQTIGAIDDAFRHAITHMSSFHFTVAEEYKKRVIELKQSSHNVFNVGSLSIDNLSNMELYSIDEFKHRFNIDMSLPSILFTFHPETVSYQRNEVYMDEIISALDKIEGFQLIITMPNADTMGNLIRNRLNAFIDKNRMAIGVESFGMKGYLSCMKHCSLMLGNTSSGYVEATYFPKYVIDLGARQNGRILTKNIHKCEIKKSAIIKSIDEFKLAPKLSEAIKIYGHGNSADGIIKILKESNG